MVNNIKNNTISEIDAKKDLNALNEIKNVEIIKYKKRTPGHKKLLNLFDDLSDIILTDKTLKSENQENENKKVESRKEENKKVESRKEENEKVESRKEENEDEDYENKYEDEDDHYKNENEYENENEDDDDKTIDQNKTIKDLNDNLDEIIGKSKSFEDQIKSLKKLEDLKEYWFMKNFDDKELKSKIFKLKLADMSNEIDKKIFEQIFGHALIKLADKLMNTINKEGNQIIVKDINKNEDKLLERDDYYDWVIQPNDQRINLLDTIKLILNFNEDQLDLV